MNGSRRGPPHWHLDVAGRRTGPHDWTVIQELARSGLLDARTLLWCPEFPAWKSVSEFPELMTPLATASTSPGAPSPAHGLPEVTHSSAAIAIGVGWAALSLAAIVMTLMYVPGLQDGVVSAQLLILIPVVLSMAGIWMISYIWRATPLSGPAGGGVLRVTVRVAVAVAVFCPLLVTLSTVINSRELFPIALGHDPLGRAGLRVLARGTELEIHGFLAAGTASRVAKMLSNNRRVRFVRLNSPGGRVDEGSQIAKLIRTKGLGTYSSKGCYSACVLAFIAGSPRVLDPKARLGLHSISAEGADPLLVEMENQDYQSFLRRAGASDEFVTRATMASPDDLWMPEPDELLRNHLVDRVSSNEFALATVGQR